MIYNSLQDNWTRVVVMHSIALNYFETTRGSDFRHRMLNRTIDNVFPFDFSSFDSMEKESCIVGMVMAWSVVTLESLLNLALVENIENKEIAIKAVEYPGQITKRGRCELAKKVIILSLPTDPCTDIVELANELYCLRNGFVHDKPFQLNNLENGDVEIEYYKARGGEAKVYRYEDLGTFFGGCHRLKNYILEKSKVDLIAAKDLNFISLTV